MLKKERHSYIVKKINLHNKVHSTDLCNQLMVSEDTIRRDLNELANKGILVKVHGGALSTSFHLSFPENQVYAREEKKKVAKKALSLIKNGMSILTGGGTTMIEMAKMVPDSIEATFYTLSPLVALELSEHINLTVIMLGGRLSKYSQINLGCKVVAELNDIGVDLCFLGTNCIDPDQGITDSDWEVVQVKKAMIQRSAKLAILSIAEKLNTRDRLAVCRLPAVDYLITDLAADHPSLDPYRGSLQII